MPAGKPPGQDTPWTTDRVAMLRKLWADDLSASQISAELNCGIGRNAVIGKVHRLGLSGRVKRGRPSVMAPRKPSRTGRFQRRPPPALAPNILPGESKPQRANGVVNAVTAQAAREDAPAPGARGVVQRIQTRITRPEGEPGLVCDGVASVPAGITLLELTNWTCRWPHGDPQEPSFRFCGRDGADFNMGFPYCAACTLVARGVKGRDYGIDPAERSTSKINF